MTNIKHTKSGAVVIVGGGIGGVQAALDLVENGFYCHIIESSPSIGGHMAMLDKTFPTNDCSACILSPKLVEVARHPNIELHTLTDIVSIDGEPGAFDITLRQRPRYVDMTRCIACGECAAKCPKKVKDRFNMGLSERKAIFLQYPQAIPLKYCIDEEECIYLKRPGRCGFCKKACPRDAINFEDKERLITVRAGAVVVDAGFSPFDPKRLDFLGYGILENVITSLEFERILSPSGPTKGHLMINKGAGADDGRPYKIAWLQCIGSRDRFRAKNAYCSSVCCMYAIKQAVIAKEHASHPIETAIFFIDQRTFGKGFEEYARRAEDSGVRFIYARPHTILKSPEGNGALRLRYAVSDKGVVEEDFDLVVLSVGLEPSSGIKAVSTCLNIPCDRDGFLMGNDFSFETGQRGIFAFGSATGPKDIPQTVMEASGVAGEAAAFLREARGVDLLPKRSAQIRDVGVEPQRIGVFICSCGINIGGVVDIEAVKEYALTLPGVVFATTNLFTCSQDTISNMAEIIRKEGLNRVVVASCSPRTHEPLFQETLEEAGINRFLFEMANIRDQDSWVHQSDPHGATEKAKALVQMAVKKVWSKRALRPGEVGVERRALVVGGGVAGMVASVELASGGFPVTLVEKTGSLGGHAFGLETRDYVASLKERVRNNPLIDLCLNTEVLEVGGSCGSFTTTLSNGQAIRHGVAILAPGGEPYYPKGLYLYGEDERVVTAYELNKRAFNGAVKSDEAGNNVIGATGLTDANEVVFIHCVGSRNKERPYCSKICCSQGIKLAISMKEADPNLRIFMLYRDIRTYGRLEYLYEKARSLGIVFIRYSTQAPPELKKVDDGRLKVETRDEIVGEDIALWPDKVVLLTPVLPSREIERLSRLFKCATDLNGFFLEAHMKLRPVDFATDGVFVCGLSHYPKPIDETVAQAKAAAGRASTILSKEVILKEAVTAEVNVSKCVGCGLCENICPYGAITLDKEAGKAQVNAGLCKGCGACVAGCRSGAITLLNEGNIEIMSSIEGALFELGA